MSRLAPETEGAWPMMSRGCGAVQVVVGVTMSVCVYMYV